MNVVLIGFRAAGKSAVGRRVAEQLGWPFLDTDLKVEACTGRTIAQIFEEEGEAGFRKKEGHVVREATASDRTVIAVGGGAIQNPENAVALSGNGYIVLLTASVAAIEKRMQLDTTSLTSRPALTGFNPLEEVEHMLAARNTAYRELCDVTVDTTEKTLEQVTQEVMDRIRALPAMERA